MGEWLSIWFCFCFLKTGLRLGRTGMYSVSPVGLSFLLISPLCTSMPSLTVLVSGRCAGPALGALPHFLWGRLPSVLSCFLRCLQQCGKACAALCCLLLFMTLSKSWCGGPVPHVDLDPAAKTRLVSPLPLRWMESPFYNLSPFLATFGDTVCCSAVWMFFNQRPLLVSVKTCIIAESIILF